MSKHEYWSSFAPLPFEYVTAAGQRAKDGSLRSGDDLEDTERFVHELTVTAGEGNIETMLSVDKGLQELAFLKVLILSFGFYSHLYIINIPKLSVQQPFPESKFALLVLV
jgi:hypothetical protein